MFGSAILEVAIGMILIFLVLSLVMTSVQEALHALMKTRARTLEQALLELMQGDQALRDRFYHHPLIYALHRGRQPPAASETAGTTPVADLPSYIPRETFSAALIDLMHRKDAAAAIPAPLRQAFEGMERVAGERVDALRTEIERWYDAAMDRASGRFKRQSQFTLFVLSLSLAVLLNFNSISLAQYLAVSPQQRALVTTLAERTLEERARATQPEAGEGEDATANASEAAQPGAATQNEAAAEPEAPPADASGNGNSVEQNSVSPGDAAADQRPSPAADSSLLPPGQVRELTDELHEIGLPIGWGATSVDWLERGFPGGKILLFRGEGSWSALFAWILLIAGYLMTAFAVMLGAPLWFDVLNKFMVIRGTVKPREKSQDEASEDRQRAPRRDPRSSEAAD